jgi:1-deoxy-D-xylulose-5-phosphate reductoisomerase
VGLAREAGAQGGTAPAVFNAANEVCVEAFLAGETRFTDIVPMIGVILRRHDVPSFVEDLTVEDVLAADAWARAETRRELERRR